MNIRYILRCLRSWSVTHSPLLFQAELCFQPPESIGDSSSHSEPTESQARCLHLAWEHNPRSRVLLTDMERVLIVSPPTSAASSEVSYETVKLDGNLAILRILVAAYVHDALPLGIYAVVPQRPKLVRESIIPKGAIMAPGPLKPDDEVFATHHRHSDFDFHTLGWDIDQALQFFRWKQHVLRAAPPVFASPGESLRGTTQAFSRRYPDVTGVFPVEDLPDDTLEHIRQARRVNAHEPTLQRFLTSNHFDIKLDEDIRGHQSVTRMCRTYSCHIVSIDGEPVPHDSSPKLVLKLVDDRFHDLKIPEEERQLSTEEFWRWFRNYITAEDVVCSENSAYNRLQFLQGSLIPYYYGAHSVCLRLLQRSSTSAKLIATSS